jgi:dTMP kinase
MFAADRIDHIQNEVLPLVEQGCLVVCDRYIYSSLAYQGSAGLSLDWIETVNQHALKPGFALFIDVSPETVLARLKRKKSVMENLETRALFANLQNTLTTSTHRMTVPPKKHCQKFCKR